MGFCGGCGCCCERSAGRPYLRAFFFFRLFPSLFLQFNLLFEAFFLSPGTQVFPVCVLRLVCVAFFSFGAFLWAMHASPRPRQSLVPWFFLRLFSSSSFFFLLLPKAGARLFSFFSRTFLVFFSVAQSKRLAYDMKRDLSHKSNPGTTHTSKTKKKNPNHKNQPRHTPLPPFCFKFQRPTFSCNNNTIKKNCKEEKPERCADATPLRTAPKQQTKKKHSETGAPISTAKLKRKTLFLILRFLVGCKFSPFSKKREIAFLR